MDWNTRRKSRDTPSRLCLSRFITEQSIAFDWFEFISTSATAAKQQHISRECDEYDSLRSSWMIFFYYYFSRLLSWWICLFNWIWNWRNFFMNEFQAKFTYMKIVYLNGSWWWMIAAMIIMRVEGNETWVKIEIVWSWMKMVFYGWGICGVDFFRAG